MKMNKVTPTNVGNVWILIGSGLVTLGVVGLLGWRGLAVWIGLLIMWLGKTYRDSIRYRQFLTEVAKTSDAEEA
jgi:hypothetical protein